MERAVATTAYEGARPADADDRPAVMSLLDQGVAELTALRGGSIWHRREAHAEAEELVDASLAGEPGLWAVVGTVDDVVVGYGLAQLVELHDGALMARISDLYVDPGARGIGVGEAMMDLLVASAQQAGAIGIDSLALPGDRATKNFFERFGLVARAIVVHRSFDPSTEG